MIEASSSKKIGFHKIDGSYTYKI